jgi:hypothetical protein
MAELSKLETIIILQPNSAENSVVIIIRQQLGAIPHSSKAKILDFSSRKSPTNQGNLGSICQRYENGCVLNHNTFVMKAHLKMFYMY